MDDPTIHVDKGTGVGRDVRVQGGKFVGGDDITINVHLWQAEPFALDAQPDLQRLRTDYLSYLRDCYRYLDFKSLPQVERIAQQIALEAVYVPLRARPEAPAGETWLRVAGREWAEEEPPGTPRAAREAAAAPVLADQALAEAPALVVLGDPGAGKSTLLKVVALALARQEQGPLPILVPLNAYAAALAQGQVCLEDFVGQYFASCRRSLRKVGALFDAALAAGQAVVLLDGLDEVQAHRPFLARLVQEFAAEHVPEPREGAVPGNRLVVTSRIVGYREAPLAGARWRTYTLVDFGREEIERFAAAWTLAFEVAVHGDNEVSREAAEKERADLLAAILANPGIERLASNPLLLTILALIKRQGVTLPQRRVELYELYLRTLISAWNKARALDQGPGGPELDYLATVQVLGPLGLWLRETNPTAGLVGRPALEDWLTDYYQQEWMLAPGPARQRGREFLEGVHRYSNLLLERGQGQYGFLHLTLEEMLAAKGIAGRPGEGPDGAVATILRHVGDPQWRETILLAVGALGVVNQNPAAAGEVLRGLCAQTLAGERRGQNVVLAGEALLDAGVVAVGPRAAACVVPALVETMQDAATPARTRRAAGLALGRLGWRPDDLDEFVAIEPGPFLHGDTKERREIPYRYWIGKYPVTNAQYARFVEAGGYEREELWSAEGWAWRTGRYDSKAPDWLRDWLKERPAGQRDRPYWWDNLELGNPLGPVVGICWFETEAYAGWLAEQLREEAREREGEGAERRAGGYGFVRGESEAEFWAGLRAGRLAARLPAEEEWERAARGTDGRAYPWGDEFAAWRANTQEGGAWDTTAVCAYPRGAGPDGVWDAAGNVWEWTASGGEGSRVVRGGSYYYDQAFARCASRRRNHPVISSDDRGVRVAVSLVLSSSSPEGGSGQGKGG